jgi:chromosome segregation ATPase
MHRELEREKQVLKGLFEDFEHQQAEMARREQQLDKQYCQLKLQMEESHAFQSSTEQMMEDCSRRIQELNQVIRTNESRHQKEMNEMEHKVESYEEKWRSVQGELDEAKDQLRGQAQEIEGKNVLIYDGQEKIKRLQKQLAQLKMETLEARVAPASQTGVKEGSGEAGNRGWGHRRTTSRRTVSATYPTTTLSHHGPVDPISDTMDPARQPKSSGSRISISMLIVR